MRIPVHTQTEEVAGGRSATSAQPRRATAALRTKVCSPHPPHPNRSASPPEQPGAPQEGLRCCSAFRPLPETPKRFVEKPFPKLLTPTQEFTMIANALLFTIVILLGYGFWLLDQLKFMARYRAVLYHAYGTTILIFVAVLFVNLFGVTLAISRRFFLKNTGRKLVASRQAVQRQPCRHARSCQRGGFQLVSRDAFSHDPQDTLDARDTSPRRSVHPAPDRRLPTCETAGIRCRKPLAVAKAPRFARSSIQPRRTQRFSARVLRSRSCLSSPRFRDALAQGNWQVPRDCRCRTSRSLPTAEIANGWTKTFGGLFSNLSSPIGPLKSRRKRPCES